jgi:hypothetical protein
MTGVILDSSGNIYGSADYAIYELSAAGKFTVLHEFAYVIDPITGLARDSSGNFYITSGGNPAGQYPNGAVFKLTPGARSACCTNSRERLCGLPWVAPYSHNTLMRARSWIRPAICMERRRLRERRGLFMRLRRAAR